MNKNKQKLKILHVIGFYDESMFYRENYYTKELAKDKSNTVYLLTSTSSLYGSKYNEGIKRKDNVVIIRKRAYIKIKDFVYFGFKNIVDKINPDVVHVYEFRQYVTFKVSKYCISKGIKVVYEHEQRGMGSTFLGWTRSLLFVIPAIKRCIDGVALIRVVTPNAKKYLMKVAGEKYNAKIYVGTLGYNSDNFFYNKELRKSFRSRYGIGDKQIAIGITGKFEKIKHVEVVVKAFKRVSNKKKELFVIGCSNIKYDKLLKDLSNSNDSIVYKNKFLNIKELNELYNGLDYLVWTRPTISYFQALGTGAYIIIPYGDNASHITSRRIIRYGNKGYNESEGYIENIQIIERELTSIFSTLNTFNRGDEIFNVQMYEISNIVKILSQQYHVILKNEA